MADLPRVTRVYQNHHLDSTRWDEYKPRAGDIIVTTAYKSGTTWTQQILYELFYGRRDPKPERRDVSPWPDARFMPIPREALGPMIDKIPGRRFIKSHLPLDGLPYYEAVQYVIVGRDARDVFMSLFNHYQSYTDLAMQAMNSPDIVGDPLPPCPDDPRTLWKDWISRGWFEWETEGYPYWANLGHTQSYWDYRHLPNFYFMHYNDMLDNLEDSVRGLCEFLGETPDDDHIAEIVQKTTFANVKAEAIKDDEENENSRAFFSGGSTGFFFKGTNGRWRDVLTEEDLALYEAAKQRVLSEDCARWLEEGGAVR